ncbi:MAG: MFS transporter [Candidatus Hodarchaeota archaeon]
MLRRSISRYTKDTLQFFGQPITFLLRQQIMILLLAVAITESAFSSSAYCLNIYFVTLESRFSIPIVLTIYYIISLTTASYFGSLSDRIGRRTLLVIGTALAGLSYIPFPLVYPLYHDLDISLWILVIANATKGLASAMMAGPVLAMFADLAPEKSHGETMGKFYLARGGGAASGFLFGGIAWDLFHETSFFFFMVIMLSATALYFFRFREPRSKASVQEGFEPETIDFQELMAETGSINPFKTVIQSLQNKQFQKFAIAWLAFSTLVGAALNYAPLVLIKQSEGASQSQVGASTLGFVFLVGAAFMGIIQPTIGKLSDSLGRKPFLVIGCVGMSLLLILIAAILDLDSPEVVDLIFNPISIDKTKSLAFPGFRIPLPHLLIVLFLAVFLLSASCFASSSLGLITDVTEEGNRGREMGMTQAITSSGNIIGVSVGGAFFGAFGILGVMAFCLGLSLLAVIIILQFLYETSGFYHFAYKLV